MKTRRFATVPLALAVLGVAGIVCPPTALPSASAQGPQDGQGPPMAPPPPMQDGGPPPMPGGGFGGGPRGQFGGQGGGGQFGGPGGQFGGPGGQFGGPGGQFGGARAPFVVGTVTAVDATAKTITVAPQFSGSASRTIQVPDTAKIVTQATATVADLKVGDKVQVQGVPTGLTAMTLTIGDNPLAAGGQGGGGFGGGRPGGPGGFGGGGGQFQGQGGPGGGGPGGGGPGGGRPGGQAAFASATGTVMATSPLTISLSGSASLVLKMDPTARVSKFSPVALSGIKVGDRIVSTGQTGDGDTFTASTVGVNMPAGGGQGGRGGFGQGGPGGRGPQFGGGPGGPFPGGPGGGRPFPGGPGGGGQFPGGGTPPPPDGQG